MASSNGKVAAFSEEPMVLQLPNGATVVCRMEASVDLYAMYSVRAEEVIKRQERFHQFGEELLIEWNLIDRKGNDIPADGKGMTSIPQSVAWSVVDAWIDRVTGVSDPLERQSNDGGTLEPTNSSRRKSQK